MPYVKKTVTAGSVIEVKKLYTSRIHTAGIPRAENRDKTSDAQAKANERKSEDRLRWKLNANFGYQDYHLVLHYRDKLQTMEQILKDRNLFLSLLRKECQTRGIKLTYIACTETKRMTNVHHHIIVNEIDLKLIQDIWAKVEEGGNISIRPLDQRGNHEELASYLIKESRSTMKRTEVKRGKRFSCSQNLVMPVPEYETVAASSWREEPKPKKGYSLYKFKDGATTRSGWSDTMGYPWQALLRGKAGELIQIIKKYDIQKGDHYGFEKLHNGCGGRQDDQRYPCQAG